MKPQNRILVCPLNWGLGHATRCMPLIDELQSQGAEVLLASDGEALSLLKKEYPDLPAFALPSYKIRYGNGNMVMMIARQLPAILKAIFQERKAIGRLVKEENIDGIISDNRYGCRVKGITSVFLSHQLNIRIPWQWLEYPVRNLHFWLIRRFDEVWIPDFKGEPNLSGELGHGIPLQREHYIGPLSRMQRLDMPEAYDVVAVLSGPEPQRMYFEEKVVSQLKNTDFESLVVRGKTDEPYKRTKDANVEIVTYLTAKVLNKKMASAKMIIARAGYSTIMDLIMMGKPAILIPTPGQTEQEYLAKRLSDMGWFLTRDQDKLNLEKALAEAQMVKGRLMPPKPGLLRKQVDQFLKNLG